MSRLRGWVSKDGTPCRYFKFKQQTDKRHVYVEEVPENGAATFDVFLCSFKPEDGEGQWRYTENELEKAFIAGRSAGIAWAEQFTAKECHQIASSHEFGFEAAKTIRETFKLEL